MRHPSGLTMPTRLTGSPRREQPVAAADRSPSKPPKVRVEAYERRKATGKATGSRPVASSATPKPKQAAPAAPNRPTPQKATRPQSEVLEEVWGRLLPEVLDRGGIREPFTRALGEIAAEQEAAKINKGRPDRAKSKINRPASGRTSGTVRRMNL